ncbi:hypothetical protein ACSW8S_19505 (plasmid) [Clostridium perfringens]
MGNLIEKDSFSGWRILDVSQMKDADKLAALKELGYIIECKNEKLKIYDLEDGEYLACESSSDLKTIDDVYLYLDKEFVFVDQKINIIGIQGKVIAVEKVNIPHIIEVIDGEEWNKYKFSELSDEEKISLINEVDFNVIKQDNGLYRLDDIQGANLASIEYERFPSLDSIIDRLSNYWNDYCILFE